MFPEAFLTADALALLLHNIFDGLVVYPASIAARIDAELPFIATEDILMEGVARGGDRQEIFKVVQAVIDQVKGWENLVKIAQSNRKRERGDER